MSDFLPHSEWTPEGDNNDDKIEVLRQALLSQLDHIAKLAEGCGKLAERQTEIVNTFAQSCLTLAEHIEKQQVEINTLKATVNRLSNETA